MSQFASLPLFVDAYMLDAGHLSDAEHGRYLLLLMTMWAAPGCRLPNDDQWLARRFRRSIEAVQNELHPIILEFCERDGNWITQKRLRKEWLWCDKNRRRKSVAAKARWDKDKKSKNAMHPTPPIREDKEEKEELRDSRRTEKVRRPSGTKIPPDWIPKEAHFAQAYALGMTANEMHIMADDMRLWAEANSNRAIARKADWDKTFSGWMRRNTMRNGNGKTGKPHKPTIMEAVDNLFERLNGPKPREADPPALRLVQDGRGK